MPPPSSTIPASTTDNDAIAASTDTPAQRELSLRAVLTGVLLGVVLTPSNVYAGLKIGWAFNMSIIALLIGFGVWQGLAARSRLVAGWTMHESNINQTVASAAASIISGGLVAPIPAYTLLTGNALDALPMMAWVFSVSFLGIWIAWYLRPSLMDDPGMTFPEGMATLETLRHAYSHGTDAMRRLLALAAAALASALVKWVDTFYQPLPRWSPNMQWERLTFTIDPSMLLLGFGAIIGIRVGLSLLLGALLAWGGIAPWLLSHGLASLPAGATGPQFAVLVEWLLWPGASLMVTATLASLALRLWRQRSVLLPGSKRGARRPAALPALASGGWAAEGSAAATREKTVQFGITTCAQGTTLGWSVLPNCPRFSRVSLRRLLPCSLLALAAALVVALQASLFDIALPVALMTVPLALFLAAVAARVVGATGIAPIGAIGQLSQLSFGVLAPGQMTVNLMSANTAGGAAGQCTDLMNDFKVGRAIGATPWKQVAAQVIGIAVGSVVGVLVYKALIPDPKAMLLTEQWPAPAVATWKAVAQTLSAGLSALPHSVRWAILAGCLAGLVLGLLDAALPARSARFLPSAAALGLAFVLPASVSLMMSLGAVLTWLAGLRWPRLTRDYAITVAAGLIAGESMTGVGASLWQLAHAR